MPAPRAGVHSDAPKTRLDAVNGYKGGMAGRGQF